MTNLDQVAASVADKLTRDLLAWLASSSRTYAETMEAWRTSCPRLSIWEDALADDLIKVETGSGTTMALARVTLTARGRAALARSLPKEPETL